MGRHSVIPSRRPGTDAVIAGDRTRPATTDHQAARRYRREAEECRRSWEAGRAREIDHVVRRAHEGDRRFRGMAARDLRTIGAVRWAQSTESKRLRRLEERYAQQATLAFAGIGMRVSELTAHGAT